MSNITIAYATGDAAGVVGYAARFNQTPNATIDLTTFQSPSPASQTDSIVLSTGFVVYLPFEATTATEVTLSTLVAALDRVYPGSRTVPGTASPALQVINGMGTPIDRPTFPFGTEGGTIYVPVNNILNATINLDGGIAALRNESSPGNTTSGESSTISSTETGVSGIPSTASTNMPGPSGAISNNDTAKINNSTPYGPGALAGGIIGAFLAALLLCALLWFFCIRRRRSRRSASQQRFSDSSNDYALADMARNPEKSQAVVAASAVTGWQKHLPQEKDDGTITKLFKSIFEQAQMHMEGYYGSDTQDLSDASIATLRELSEDDLPLMLSQTQKQVLLLEGILLRFMIRRISGRCDVQDSFLPGDLSRIAKNNKWYMERESGQSGVAASGKKRGFSQALAQWRQLTGFLLPNHRDDQAYQNELRTKIEAAVQNIDSAYSPWEISGKNGDKRRESLRGILQQVSDAGILLFTQPSTFLFDWSTPAQSDSRTVAISPALLRENEGSAREDVLIKGSQGKL